MSFRAKIEPFANRVGVWSTFFGAVWGGMSWVASNVTPLGSYGWGSFVFMGLGAACALSLVLSVALVAWRYFTPLPVVAPIKLGQGTMRQANFISHMQFAETTADYNLEQTPHDQRPNVDALLLRKYVIANWTCWQAITFLQSQKSEKEAEILNQRGQLIERLTARNNPSGS